MRVVDLSHPVETGMQVFPGDPSVSCRVATTVEQDGFEVTELHLGTHSGTHMDAPSHIVAGGATIDELSLGDFVGPCRVVHVPDPGARDVIGWGDVREQLADLRPGDAVLFRTDWSRHFGTAHYLAHPALHAEIAQHLLTAGVRVMGVDTLNPDHTPQGEHDSGRLPFHERFLGSGGVILENLTNLGDVTWAGPVLCALPLRLRGLDGSPVRAVALQL